MLLSIILLSSLVIPNAFADASYLSPDNSTPNIYAGTMYGVICNGENSYFEYYVNGNDPITIGYTLLKFTPTSIQSIKIECYDGDDVKIWTITPIIKTGEDPNFTSMPDPDDLIESEVETYTEKKSGSGCSGDCTAPTFGENKSGRLLVTGGFELNGNATDVTNYHVDYDLIVVDTNYTHNIKLKVYESTALKWIQVGFGIPEIGASMNDAEAIALFRIGYDDILDEVETFDKDALVDITRASLTSTSCSSFISSECYLLDFDFVPRDQLKNNVIMINAVDVYGYSSTHYINDGMLVVGESMNEPLESHVAVSNGGAFYPQRAGTVDLILIDYKTDTWQDTYGYLWTSDNYKSFRIIDAIPVPIKDADPMWDVMTRMNSNFPDLMNIEIEKAQKYLDDFNAKTHHVNTEY